MVNFTIVGQPSIPNSETVVKGTTVTLSKAQTLPDGTVIPVGSREVSSDNTLKITTPDGDIIWRNSQVLEPKHLPYIIQANHTGPSGLNKTNNQTSEKLESLNLIEINPTYTNLEAFRRLNTPDRAGSNKLKPAESAMGAKLEPLLGVMSRFENVNSRNRSPDFEIIDGQHKGKTIDVMYTTNRLSDKEIEGINRFYEKNMSVDSQGFSKGRDTIQDHLDKADYVPVDFRVL